MKKAILLLFIAAITVLSACSEEEVKETLETIAEKTADEPQIGDTKDNPIPVQLNETIVAEEEESDWYDPPYGKAEFSMSNFKLEKELIKREQEEEEKEEENSGGMFSIEEKTDEYLQSLEDERNSEWDYIHLDISLKNLGEGTLSSGFLSPWSFDLYNDNGMKLDYKFYNNSSTYEEAELRAGGSNEGHVILAIPEGEIPAELIYDAKFRSNTIYYSFKLN